MINYLIRPMKEKLLLLFFLLPWLMFAQFGISTSTTGDSCGSNGSVTITVTNATPGATFDFQIRNLSSGQTLPPETGIIAGGTTFTHTIPTLSSGNYSLTAYQNANGNVTQTNGSFTIADDHKELVFTNVVTYSCLKGNIRVNVTQGQPTTYELLDTNQTVLRSQTTNEFLDVAPGSYIVKVSDCKESKTTGVTVSVQPNNYTFSWATTNTQGFNFYRTCNTIDHRIMIAYNANNRIPAEKFPLTITYTVTGPGGSPVTVIEKKFNNYAELTNTSLNNIELPAYYNQAFTIKGEIADACGTHYTSTYNVPAEEVGLLATQEPASCGGAFLRLSRMYRMAPPFTVEFIEAPSDFKPWLYSTNFSEGSYSGVYDSSYRMNNNIDFGSSTSPIPAETYKIKITDACGRTIERAIEIATGLTLSARQVAPGCGENYGGINLYVTTLSNTTTSVGKVTKLDVISGPTSFSTSYPVNINNAIHPTGGNAIVNLPVGEYTFVAETDCGTAITKTFRVEGARYTHSKSISYNCQSYNYSYTLSSNLNNAYYFLQKYNESTNTWTDVQGVSNNGSNVTNFTFTNLTETGLFRAVVRYNTYTMGAIIEANNANSCREVLDTFTINPGGLTLNNFYVVTCADNTYNLIIDATGVAPLKYEIIEKDGTAIAIDNGNDPVFTNLLPGVYRMRISDNCGNAITNNIRVVANKLPKINTFNICNGQNGRLYVDGLSFLTIKWYKDGVDTGVTGNAYNFSPYDSTKHTGLYEARLSYNPNPNSCIDNILSFNLTTENENNPSAGVGGTYTIYTKDVSGTIDLFDYLKLSNAPYDDFGQWEEVSNSGLLIDNNWYAQFANGGTYTFNYTVEGTCSGSDTSTVIIHLIGACYKEPTATGDALDSKFGITTLGRGGTNNENWPMARKGAHMVLESKTKGFVINRMASPETTIPTANLVDGMMVYDTDDQCLKIYVKDENTPTNSGWKCFKNQTCND
ncbi:MAG: UDP-N-acetylglucosamine enolpyruvyl transferase [Cruoricaptor ignavus]|nr:UDP-N-acetylglucosamine enolpyruvyl transferase [Cruoricaptor ignavus]